MLRTYRLGLTGSDHDYDTIVKVLASIDERMLEYVGFHAVQFRTEAYTPHMTAVAYVVHGLLDAGFIDYASYKDEGSDKPFTFFSKHSY